MELDEGKFLSSFAEELKQYPIALERMHRGKLSRGGPFHVIGQGNDSIQSGDSTTLTKPAHGNDMEVEGNGTGRTEEAGRSNVDFWSALETKLKERVSAQKTSAIINKMMREHLDFVSKLSLDEIEELATTRKQPSAS